MRCRHPPAQRFLRIDRNKIRRRNLDRGGRQDAERTLQHHRYRPYEGPCVPHGADRLRRIRLPANGRHLCRARRLPEAIRWPPGRFLFRRTCACARKFVFLYINDTIWLRLPPNRRLQRLNRPKTNRPKRTSGPALKPGRPLRRQRPRNPLLNRSRPLNRKTRRPRPAPKSAA